MADPSACRQERRMEELRAGAGEGRTMKDRILARLNRRWLMLPVTAAWVALFAVTITYLIVGLPARLSQLSVPCTESSATASTACAHYQLSEVAEQVLLGWGLSLSAYAWFLTSLIFVVAPIYFLLALIILVRSRGQLMMLCPAFGLLLFVPGYFPSIAEAISHHHPGWLALLGLLQVIAIWIGILFGYTFPSGTFFPRWTRPLMVVATITVILLAFYPTARLFSSSGSREAYWLSFVTLALFATALWAQISRYRHLSSALEREQTKWVVFGFSILVVEMLGFGLAPQFFPALGQPGRLEVFYIVTNGLASAVVAVVLAVAFGVAILRYRLFDIDVIINRTLVYTALSVTLGTIYVSGVLLGEFLLRPLTPESDIAVALSTLAVVALFQPIRRRIQDNVDRRFFRRKYDAERTITSFRAIARNEVDLDRLNAELMRVIHETMQPSHVSLWLRKR
jgi:hypothetical protein